MSGRQSFLSCPKTHFAFSEKKCVVQALPLPKQNQLLAALPRQDYERLLPDLEPFHLPFGLTIYDAGEQEQYLYFPTTGVVSHLYVSENGASTEYAATGCEGVIGLASFLGGDRTPTQAVVLSAGYAYRLSADLLNKDWEQGGALPQLLLRYTQALITQVAQTAVCNRHHSVEQQLCRWLLSRLDRLHSNDLTMSQELIANMLGVRRESVTEAAGKLQMLGLINYNRGHITVINRAKLETQVCECYGVVKREYQRLLPPKNNINNTTTALSYSNQNVGRV
jgi:CRP-like cAMP-binding protein